MSDYIVHIGHDPRDGTAYFGPIPADEADPLNSDAAEFWAQCGDIEIEPLPADAVSNTWADWLSVVSDD